MASSQKQKHVLLLNPIRAVMAGYLLSRCKHLCMFIFRVVSPSLAETK